MTDAEAAERLEKVLEHAKAGKSCRVEEEALTLAICALKQFAKLEQELDEAILYWKKEADE